LIIAGESRVSLLFGLFIWSFFGDREAGYKSEAADKR
jgi:hypothetical protein